MLSCPQLQPMFYVLKELTRRYHLLHPREGGIRSYALIIMLLFIMGKYPHQPLGKTLLDFLYYFGYYHTYSFADSSLTGYDKDIMLINVGNPLYKDDNVARYINVYDFQRMCRATYIALHSNIRSNRLGFIFELPQFILQ